MGEYTSRFNKLQYNEINAIIGILIYFNLLILFRYCEMKRGDYYGR